MRGICIGVVLLVGGMASAADPILPVPRPLPGQIVGPISYIRPNPYDVWQAYDVDRFGRFRPLVAPSYGGVRYVATGEPYPFWQNHPQWVKPVIGNRATFQGSTEPPLLIGPAPAPEWYRMPYADK